MIEWSQLDLEKNSPPHSTELILQRGKSQPVATRVRYVQNEYSAMSVCIWSNGCVLEGKPSVTP